MAPRGKQLLPLRQPEVPVILPAPFFGKGRQIVQQGEEVRAVEPGSARFPVHKALDIELQHILQHLVPALAGKAAAVGHGPLGGPKRFQAPPGRFPRDAGESQRRPQEKAVGDGIERAIRLHGGKQRQDETFPGEDIVPVDPGPEVFQQAPVHEGLHIQPLGAEKIGHPPGVQIQGQPVHPAGDGGAVILHQDAGGLALAVELEDHPGDGGRQRAAGQGEGGLFRPGVGLVPGEPGALGPQRSAKGKGGEAPLLRPRQGQQPRPVHVAVGPGEEGLSRPLAPIGPQLQGEERGPRGEIEIVLPPPGEKGGVGRRPVIEPGEHPGRALPAGSGVGQAHLPPAASRQGPEHRGPPVGQSGEMIPLGFGGKEELPAAVQGKQPSPQLQAKEVPRPVGRQLADIAVVKVRRELRRPGQLLRPRDIGQDPEGLGRVGLGPGRETVGREIQRPLRPAGEGGDAVDILSRGLFPSPERQAEGLHPPARSGLRGKGIELVGQKPAALRLFCTDIIKSAARKTGGIHRNGIRHPIVDGGIMIQRRPGPRDRTFPAAGGKGKQQAEGEDHRRRGGRV